MQILIPDLTGQAVDCYLGPFSLGAAAGEDVDGFLQLAGGSAESGAFSNCWYTTPDIGAPTSEIGRGFGGLILLIVGLYVGSAVFSGLMFYLMAWAGYKALRDLQADVFNHLHRLSLGSRSPGYPRRESGFSAPVPGPGR